MLEADREFALRVRAFDRSLHTLSIGFCAPVPQIVLTPILNNVFDGMTISADMADDSGFPEKLEDETYQLAVMHFLPESSLFYGKKCGHEDLFISLDPGNPLAFYPVFSSSYYIRRKETLPGRMNIAIADPECHTDYYLICLASEKKKYKALFDLVTEHTIR